MATTRRKPDDPFAPVGDPGIETLEHADDRIAETLRRREGTAPKPAVTSDEKAE